MLPFNTLSYRPFADVPVGNLVYLLRESGPVIALRVAHPPGAVGGNQPSPAALVLLERVGNKRIPIVDRGSRTQHCIDWGIKPTVLWSHPITAVARNSTEQLAPGYLVLAGDKTAITSYYAGGKGEPMHWNVLTGLPVELGQFDFIFVAQWRLGVTAANGSFLTLAAYPDDYAEAR